ncbi:DUF805 domain-containing protein [Hoylesella buccalis]|uniref:DUF805 domain-containing protein n=1 Tax=Hoylesella buccalis TaxID=28127 RepID=UPI0026F06E53|nr:DUF805 domain-containing protein [Hoylesella buccalis]
MPKLIEKPQPSFPEAVRKGCNRLFDFHGRTRRSDFWWFMLAFMVCNLILTNIWEAFLPPLAAVICNLAVLSLALAITVRRLQTVVPANGGFSQTIYQQQFTHYIIMEQALAKN